MANRYAGKALSLLIALVLLSAPFQYFVATIEDRDEEEMPVHQCGCPQEKVLSHTCCCALAKRNCCAAHAAEKPSANTLEGQTSAAPVFCRAGCSLPERLITDSTGKNKFASAPYLHGIFVLNFLLAQTADKKPENAFLEVSVPPPKNTIPFFI